MKEEIIKSGHRALRLFVGRRSYEKTYVTSTPLAAGAGAGLGGSCHLGHVMTVVGRVCTRDLMRKIPRNALHALFMYRPKGQFGDGLTILVVEFFCPRGPQSKKPLCPHS